MLEYAIDLMNKNQRFHSTNRAEINATEVSLTVIIIIKSNHVNWSEQKPDNINNNGEK